MLAHGRVALARHEVGVVVMTTQAWPLWAVRHPTGQVYAVIGWDPSGVAIGVELNIKVDGAQAVLLAAWGMEFFTNQDRARLAASQVVAEL